MKLLRITTFTLLFSFLSLAAFSQTDGNGKKKKPKAKQTTYTPAYNSNNDVWGEVAARVIVEALKITIEVLAKAHK